jgi:hypothetical protein
MSCHKVFFSRVFGVANFPETVPDFSQADPRTQMRIHELLQENERERNLVNQDYFDIHDDEDHVILCPKWALRNFGRILQEFHGNLIEARMDF